MEREYLINYVTRKQLVVDVKYYIVNDSLKTYVNTDQLVFDSNNMDALREFDIDLCNAFSELQNSTAVISDTSVEYAITLLTPTSLSLLTKRYYNSTTPGKMEYFNTRRCFVNIATDIVDDKTNDRAILQKLLDEGYYNFILTIWGVEPTLDKIDQRVYKPE